VFSAVACITLAVLVAACSSATSTTSGAPGGSRGSASPGSPSGQGTAGAQGSGCLSHDEAVSIWTDIDHKLNAIELDPKHAGVANVATGQALELINQYLQTQLISSNFTEKEVDKLESLTVIDAGCNGGDLQVNVSETVVQDDYLRADGSVDHADSSVGSTLQLAETYIRVGGTWKQSDFRDLSSPTATPQLV